MADNELSSPKPNSNFDVERTLERVDSPVVPAQLSSPSLPVVTSQPRDMVPHTAQDVPAGGISHFRSSHVQSEVGETRVYSNRIDYRGESQYKIVVNNHNVMVPFSKAGNC